MTYNNFTINPRTNSLQIMIQTCSNTTYSNARLIFNAATMKTFKYDQQSFLFTSDLEISSQLKMQTFRSLLWDCFSRIFQLFFAENPWYLTKLWDKTVIEKIVMQHQKNQAQLDHVNTYSLFEQRLIQQVLQVDRFQFVVLRFAITWPNLWPQISKGKVRCIISIQLGLFTWKEKWWKSELCYAILPS